jgi:lincosamide nucleotidyltransferase B/F
VTQASLDALDVTLRTIFRTEPAIRYALAYGSRTQVPPGPTQHDGYSDLEYYVYPEPGHSIDPRELVKRATPVVLAVTNPFGTPNFVTPELHRTELHVQDADRMADLLTWPVLAPDAGRMLIKDTDGKLSELLRRFAQGPQWSPEPAQQTYDNVLGALVAVCGFLARGERLRAYEWHSLWVVGGLIRLARYAERSAQPPAVARWAERDLSGTMLERLRGCTLGEGRVDLAWTHSLDLCADLGVRAGLEPRAELISALTGVRCRS